MGSQNWFLYRMILHYRILNWFHENLRAFWNLFLGLCVMAFLKRSIKKEPYFTILAITLLRKSPNKFARSSRLFKKFKSAQNKHNYWRRSEKGFHFLSVLPIFRWKKVYKLWQDQKKSLWIDFGFEENLMNWIWI